MISRVIAVFCGLALYAPLAAPARAETCVELRKAGENSDYCKNLIRELAEMATEARAKAEQDAAEKELAAAKEAAAGARTPRVAVAQATSACAAGTLTAD